MPDLKSLTIAISPCPNDSYIFGAWVLGLTGDIEGYRSRFFWSDVEALNEKAEHQEFDVVKVSAVQALKLEESYHILKCGAAFGLEHGPKLVCLKEKTRGAPGRCLKGKFQRIGVPGLKTTAFWLLKAALEYEFEPVPMLFDQIPLAVLKQKVDAGLVIHETALVYQQYGLDLVLDLGKWWQARTGNLPLPLGLIVARKTLASANQKLILSVQEKIESSIRFARSRTQSVWPFIKSLAQEMDDRVIEEHIDAYVNKYSLEMGEAGEQALLHLRKLIEG
jgi:1,4-dihydroxy-6-naphthoate synthase